MSAQSQWDVIVIGAGAAGLLAGARAAERGAGVLLLEKARKAGVKILMSGGTRCNLTHAIEARGIVEAFGHQGPFLHSALAALPPDGLVALIESEGVKTKVESTGKIFPESDRAVDVRDALLRRLRRSGAEYVCGEAVVDLREDNGLFQIVTSQRSIAASRVVVTTGGQSYPGCGTTGDGYAWARALGHTIIKPRPALVPLKIRADWAKSLRGITLPDVLVRVVEEQTQQAGKRKRKTSLPPGVFAERRGSMLFAHFGLSGPVVLDVSREVALHPLPRSLSLVCDFLPEKSAATLAEQIREFAISDGKRHVAALLSQWLPRRLVDALAEQANIPVAGRAAELSRIQRSRFVDAVKSTAIPVTGTLGFEKAEVTAGGVSLDEIDSRSMQSKLVDNLFFAGEILDLDGPIGGYNFQSAFSTGWLAGENV